MKVNGVKPIDMNKITNEFGCSTIELLVFDVVLFNTKGLEFVHAIWTRLHELQAHKRATNNVYWVKSLWICEYNRGQPHIMSLESM